MCMYVITDTSCMIFPSVVKVDNLVSQWQQMGVEATLDTSLEDVLSEVLSMTHDRHYRV